MKINDKNENALKNITSKPTVSVIEDEQTGKYRLYVSTDDGQENNDNLPNITSLIGEYNHPDDCALIASFIRLHNDANSENIIKVPTAEEMEQISGLFVISENEEE